MAKIINITDKLSNEKPAIQVGDKVYEIDDSMKAVLRFEELQQDSSTNSLKKALSIALGEEAVAELDIESMSMPNFKVFTIGVLGAMQGLTYEESEERFQSRTEKQA